MCDKRVPVHVLFGEHGVHQIQAQTNVHSPTLTLLTDSRLKLTLVVAFALIFVNRVHDGNCGYGHVSGCVSKYAL